MAWDGSGNFTRTNGTNTGAATWQDDAAAATKIRADRHDTHDEDLSTGIDACITQNGESKATSDFDPGVTSSLDMGSDSLTWQHGYFEGIKFPATQVASSNANTLDDYQEGIWTVELYDASSGGNVSPTTVTGYYTKIGNQVTARFGGLNSISTSGMTAGNTVYITLPLSSGATGASSGSIVMSGVSLSGSRTQANSLLRDSFDRAQIQISGSSLTDTSLIVSDITTGTCDISNFCITYTV